MHIYAIMKWYISQFRNVQMKRKSQPRKIIWMAAIRKELEFYDLIATQ